MGLFSSLRKDKQAPAADDSAYSPREDKGADQRPAANRRTRKPGARSGIDPVLPEKKRARRRLVGAIALVVAAIIVVPMIFDSEPKPLTTDIAVNIPSREPTAADKAAADAEAAAQASAQEQAASASDSGAPPLPAGQVPSMTAPALPPSATPPAVAPAPSPLPPAPLSEKPAPAPKPAPPKPKPAAPEVDEYSRAQAILSGKIDSLPPPPKEAAPSSNKFVVQVAALSSEEKAKELQDQLKASGIQSYTQRISTSSGLRIRVRVGPFSSRDEADKMLGRVSKLGLGGSVVPA